VCAGRKISAVDVLQIDLNALNAWQEERIDSKRKERLFFYKLLEGICIVR